MEQCSFGGGCINDTLIHLATSEMGFGGFGESGMGAYHGEEGFRTFSHYKSIVNKKPGSIFPCATSHIHHATKNCCENSEVGRTVPYPHSYESKMHSKSPSVMAFCFICLWILAKNMPKHSRDTTF